MTFTTHDEYVEATSSEKIVLAHVHGTKRLYNFITDTGIVSRVTTNFVNKVSQITVSTQVRVELTRVASIGAVTDATKFFFDIPTSKLFLFEFDTTLDEIIVEFRLFFSNAPIITAWDLTDDSSDEVEYEARIDKAPQFKSQMSQGKKGINLVGKGNLVINANDGELDVTYDNLFFDNGDVNVYTTHRDLDPTDAQIIFKGNITGRNWSRNSIIWVVSDNNFKLDTLVSTTRYSTEVRDADKNNHKRVIYGRADNLICQSLDQYELSGNNNLTGTIAGVSGNSFILGTGTVFLDEVSLGDEILIDATKTATVVSVKSDTLMLVNTLTSSFNTASSGQANILPVIQYSNKNREFQVAGHSVKKYSTTVTANATTSRFIIGDTEGFEVDDVISVGSDIRIIQRVSLSTNSITITVPISPEPSVSTVVTKLEVANVRYSDTGILIDDTNITIDNTDNSHTKITFTADAEQEATPLLRSKDLFTFINGSSVVWLGTPAIFTITTIAHTSGSLDGDFFILRDESDTEFAFWYGDTGTSAPVDANFVAVDSDRQIKIVLTEDKTSTEIATITTTEMQKVLDFFTMRSSTNVITLDSTAAQPITTPTAETSGFTMALVSTGIAPTTSIPSTILPRDFIRADGSSTEYDVLSVTGTSILLRIPFAQSDVTTLLEYRNISYIGDTTKVFVDTFGKTKDGTKTGDLIITGPDAVSDVLLNSGFTASDLDSATFTDASVRAPALISVVVPKTPRGTPVKVKTFIDDINKTLFGSLFINQDLLLGYDILDADADIASLRTITEADVVDWKVSSEAFDIVNKVNGTFKFVDFDPEIGDSSSSEVDYENPFVGKYLTNTNESDRDLFLFDEVEAQEAVERESFINSFSNATIKLKGSLGLSRFRMGERVLLDLDRMYVPMGSTGSKRVGIITSIKSTGEKTEIEIEDIGGIYMRAARISEDSAPDYDSSTEDEKLKNSFIVADDEIITTDENTFSTNLIG